MKDTYYAAAKKLIDHLLSVDLSKLTPQELDGYANTFLRLKELYDPKPDYMERMTEIMSKSATWSTDVCACGGKEA